MQWILALVLYLAISAKLRLKMQDLRP